MRYIVLPPPIQLADQTYGLRELVAYVINTDSRYNETGPGIRAAIKVEAAFAKDGPVVELDQDLWLQLREVIEAPSRGYPSLVARKADGTTEPVLIGRLLLPFIDAVSQAKDEPPPKPEAPAAEAPEEAPEVEAKPAE